MNRLLTLPLLTGLIGIGSPFMATAVEAPSELQEMLRGIDGMRRLPVQGMQMVRAGERVLFVSANGRYVFTGPVWNLWHGAALDSLDTAGRLAERIDLQRLRLDPQALGALQLGNGEEAVVIFVDPRCPHCHGPMSRLPALAERYRFLLVPLPILGPGSEDAVARLGRLATSDAAAVRDALLNDKADELPEPTPSCGQAPAQRALVAAQLLGIAGVPFLIAPGGRLQQGVPENLEAWLEGTP